MIEGRGDPAVKADEDDPLDLVPDRPIEAPASLRTNPRTIALVILALLAVLYTLYFARAVLFPVTIAFLLNLLLSPLVRRLHKAGLPEGLGAAVILFGFVAAITVLAALLYGPAARWVREAPQKLPQLEQKTRTFAASFQELRRGFKKVEQVADLDEGEQVTKVTVAQPGLATAALQTTGSFLAGAMVAVVLLYFLLASGDNLLETTVSIMPTWREKRKIVELVRQVQQSVSKYLYVTTVINITLGCVIGAGLWLIGMPNALLWGAMACVFNYIPFIGLFAGTAIVTLVAFWSFDSVGYALLAPAIYLTANIIEANFITPTMLGRSVSLNPSMVFLSLTLWGWMWGVGGMIIAVPMLATLKIFCDHYEPLAPLGKFLAR